MYNTPAFYQVASDATIPEVSSRFVIIDPGGNVLGEAHNRESALFFAFAQEMETALWQISQGSVQSLDGVKTIARAVLSRMRELLEADDAGNSLPAWEEGAK